MESYAWVYRSELSVRANAGTRIVHRCFESQGIKAMTLEERAREITLKMCADSICSFLNPESCGCIKAVMDGLQAVRDEVEQLVVSRISDHDTETSWKLRELVKDIRALKGTP